MEDQLYREIILEHWENPQNYGVIKNPDIDASDTNPTCGDTMRITGKIKNGKLIDILFTGEGCAISKASASMFTERVKGKQVLKIKKITAQNILDEFPVDLAPARYNCALLVLKTLQKAI